MAKHEISERDYLIEQCLQDAYCERTGEILQEGFGDWLAGKKAKLGTKMSNLATGAKNAIGAAKNATSNAIGAMRHAADNRAFKKDAAAATARAARLRRRGDDSAADAEDQMAQTYTDHSNTKFQGTKF